MALDRWLTVVPGTAAAGGQQAAFLVDADNFSDALALESAWAQLQARAGRVSVCRAYGAPTRLQSLAAVWRSLGARTFPNLALDKNTTDAALIADAVALHFQQGVRLFAIASGDADFAPLAVRLREWGCEVWCFSMGSILFAGAEAYYDRVVRFAPSPVASGEPVVASAAPAKKTSAPAAVAVEVEKPPPPVAAAVPVAVVATAPIAPAPPVASVAPAVLLPPVRVVVPKPKPVPALPVVLPDMVQRILQAVPALREAPQMLSQVVPVLRQKTILGKTTKSTAFFASYSAYFKLIPADKPTQLAYVPPRHAAEKSAHPVPLKPVAAGEKKFCALPTVPVKVPVAIGPVAICLKDAPPLLAELHGLRAVLVQLALRRVTVADVLLAAPEVAVGLLMDLESVCKKLCNKGVVASPAYARAILMAYPSSFCLVPPKTPNAVRYLG